MNMPLCIKKMTQLYFKAEPKTAHETVITTLMMMVIDFINFTSEGPVDHVIESDIWSNKDMMRELIDGLLDMLSRFERIDSTGSIKTLLLLLE